MLGAEADRLLRHDPAPRSALVVRAGEGSRTSEIATLIDRHPHDSGRTEVFDFTPRRRRARALDLAWPGLARRSCCYASGRLRVGPLDATVELARRRLRVLQRRLPARIRRRR